MGFFQRYIYRLGHNLFGIFIDKTIKKTSFVSGGRKKMEFADLPGEKYSVPIVRMRTTPESSEV